MLPPQTASMPASGPEHVRRQPPPGIIAAVNQTADNPVRKLVLSVHRRLLRLAMAEAAGAGVLLAGVMALAARLLLPQAGHLDGLLAGAMVGAAFAMVRYVSRRPDPLAAAIACDQAAGTPELFSTAWTLPPTGQPDPLWQQTIMAQAHHALNRVDLTAILHGRAHPGRLIVGLMLLLSAALWPAQILPPSAHTSESLASAGASPLDSRPLTASPAWPAPSPRTRPSDSAGETSRTGGPELLTAADAAAAKIDPNARHLGDESGGNASAGRGPGSGFSKGTPTAPSELPPPGKAAYASPSADLASGDGTASRALARARARAASPGQVLTNAEPTPGQPSLSGDSSAPTGPTAAEVAATPAPYRAAVREYFNR